MLMNRNLLNNLYTEQPYEILVLKALLKVLRSEYQMIEKGFLHPNTLLNEERTIFPKRP